MGNGVTQRCGITCGVVTWASTIFDDGRLGWLAGEAALMMNKWSGTKTGVISWSVSSLRFPRSHLHIYVEHARFTTYLVDPGRPGFVS
jgi:hypothetical protein